ncbi:MAG: FdrA protein [Gammaproteobacteria bacterium]|jgi:FdrA protein
MSGFLTCRVKPQFYLDSVALMRMSRALANGDGIQDAAMMMATPANIAILSNAGLLDSSDTTAGAGDLVIAVRADTAERAAEALAEAEKSLTKPQASVGGEQWRPRSIRTAVQNHPDAGLALISVPGAFAISEARKAIRRGLHVMIFSDNVPLAEEVALKLEARALGRLVMGPDCGTSIINGVPMAFANELPRGDIGIVGASGTGIQEVSCLLAGMGKGISHAIGVGGRDLTHQVGGISTLMALDMLEADAATRHIVIISKPPAADVAEAVLAQVARSSKSFTICFIGGDKPTLPTNAVWATTLATATESAGNAKLADEATTADADEPTVAVGWLRGLFCGGTLCAEAQVICKMANVAVSSNAAIPGVANTVDAAGHTLIDLGADEYTQGKPHPMIEPSVRDQELQDALADDQTAVLLLDVVIGYGAHVDPAGHLVNSLPAQRTVPVIASVTGTEQDPQVRSRQIDILRRAGIQVASSNANAVKMALAHLQH